MQQSQRVVVDDHRAPGPVPGPALSRRRALRLLISGAGLSILAACAPAPAPTSAPTKPTEPPKPAAPAPTSAPTSPPAAQAKPTEPTKPAAPAPTLPTSGQAVPVAKPTAQPKTGGTLRIAIPADIAYLDGHYRPTPAGYESLWNAFDRLTAYDDKLQPHPMLAESFDVSTDGKQFKFNLHKGVQFHTGREMTSEDVNWNLLRVRDVKVGAGGFVNQSNWFTTIELPDKYTIILKSEQPRPAAFDFFEFFNILDKETIGDATIATTAIGTGPFVLSERIQGDRIRLTRNKSYWQSGRPYLDEIVVTVLPDSQAMVTQLEAGAQDVIVLPPWRDLARLKPDPKYQALTNPMSGAWYVSAANCIIPPTDNKLLRQALSFALDRKRFAESVMFGLVQPRALPWTPGSPAYDAEKNNAHAFNLDKAGALVKESGLSNVELGFLINPDFPELYDFGQIYQADLAKIGVKLNVNRVENAVWFDQANNRKYIGLHAINAGFGQLEPLTNLSASRLFDPNSNNSGFKNDRYSQLVAQVASEPDAAKRKQLYGQINDLLLDEAFSLAIASGPARLLMRSTVRDHAFTMHEGSIWSNVWLDA